MVTLSWMIYWNSFLIENILHAQIPNTIHRHAHDRDYISSLNYLIMSVPASIRQYDNTTSGPSIRIVWSRYDYFGGDPEVKLLTVKITHWNMPRSWYSLIPHLTDDAGCWLHLIETFSSGCCSRVGAVALLVHQAREHSWLRALCSYVSKLFEGILSCWRQSPTLLSPPTLFAGVLWVPEPPEVAVALPEFILRI